MSEEELAQISASAFLNMVLHIFRFWSDKPTGEKNIAYGVLLGKIEGNIRTIKKVVPILHQKNSDYEMGKDFMKIIGQINASEMEMGSINEVIGWYRSSNRGIKFTARDTKNHIQFQEHNPRFIGLIFSPEIYMDPKEYGFSVFRLRGDSYYNMMTDNYKIPWEILPIEDAQEVITDFKLYIQNYFLDKPLLTEFNE
ncbi:MAG: hypothetical protein ACTSR8_16685 [Promethearchaeota archaeon]